MNLKRISIDYEYIFNVANFQQYSGTNTDLLNTDKNQLNGKPEAD